MHRCPNNACPSRGLETLINWVMAAADIEGVGEQFVRRLWDLAPALDPDLYRLTTEQLAELDGYAEISARNAIDAIAASKQIPFARVLFGLNIPDVGLGDGAEPRPSFRIRGCSAAARQEDIEEVDGIGPTVRSRSQRGSRTKNRALVEELRSLGICSSSARPSAPSRAC